MANRSKKIPTGMRLTSDAVALLRALSEKNGVSQTAIAEMAIREKAARDGVAAKADATP